MIGYSIRTFRLLVLAMCNVFFSLNIKMRLIIAASSLVAGCYIYLLFRPPLYPFIRTIQEWLLLPLTGCSNVIIGSAPSFFHTFAFVIFTSFFLSEKLSSFFINAITWLIISFFIEIMQFGTFSSHFSFICNKVLIKKNQIMFVPGTFDKYDLLAILFGSVLSFFYLVLCQRREK